MRRHVLAMVCKLAATVCALAAAGCDSSGQALDQGPSDSRPADGRADLAHLTDGAGGTDTRPDRALADGSSTPAGSVARGVIHVHSIYSHDGCDSKGFVGGKPNTTCLKQLRDAACGRKLDFVALTDHPSNLSSYTLQEGLLYDSAAGDQLVLQSGNPIANRVTCTGGHQVLFSVGFESSHMMPLGLNALPSSQSLYSGVSDTTPLATLQQQVQGLKALGAVVSMVHTEETDISAATIASGGFEAMEWYNLHANFKVLIGSDTLSADIKNLPTLVTLVNKLLGLKDFLAGGSGAPHSDLVYLVFLDSMPKEGFTKWRAALKTHKVTGLLGSDIHQNVSVDSSMCAGALQLACTAALALVEGTLGLTLPSSIKSTILSGGSIALADGDRIDSWGRLMRWFENRVLAQASDPTKIQQALRDGRLYGVLTVFGDPDGFSFGGTHSGSKLVLGDSAQAPVTLAVQAPTQPKTMTGGATFGATDALKAEVRTQLYRTDGTGTALVQEVSGLGKTITLSASAAGAYHVEVWIKPKHLTTALGPSQSLASKEYLWLITNPIRVTN